MPIAAPYAFARGTPEASLFEQLRESLADARFALAEREAVAHLLAPEVDPTLLLGFMVEFAALSVQLQEPVEQFLVAASGRCEQLGERKAARELLRLAHDAIERYADFADDTRALTLRWNAAHQPELDLTGLLTQPNTRAMRRLFALHNQLVTSDEPWAELALICELESMTAAVAPLLVLHAERRLGADIRSGMRGVIGTAVAGDRGRARTCLAQLFVDDPARLATIVHTSERLLELYGDFLDDCMVAALNLARWRERGRAHA